MKKKFLGLLIMTILAGMLFSAGIVSVASEKKENVNRYNVVFVTDASGSMSKTDPEEYRIESIELFTSLLSNGGNRVGSVVFGDGVTYQHDIIDVNGKTEKNKIMEGLRNQSLSGWTDIGSALETAVDMLEKDGNKELPSIIILLTDGNTDMKTPEKLQESLLKKEEAMEEARQNGYQIYTISLNKDNTANSVEMQQIASATGGEFREVTSAEDLQSVFDLYYQMIYTTTSTQLVDETVPADGIISRDFSVADLGVEEVNVVVFGQTDSIGLRRPDGAEVSESELETMLYNGQTFTMIKIPAPEKGIWNFSVNAEPNSRIRIFKIYNPNLNISATIKNEKDSYVKDEAVEFCVKIKEDDTVIDEVDRYEDYQAQLTVTDYEGNEVSSSTAETVTEEGFLLSFVPEKYGTYYAKIAVTNGELSAETEMLSLNVGNTPPVVKKQVIEKHINRWPFLIKTDATIDLSEAAEDAEDETLQFQVKSSSWMKDDYTLKGEKLTIDNFSVSKGSFTIEAYDSLGAYCSFEVKVTSTNIGLWVVILILAAGVLIAGILGITAYRELGKPFAGSFTVESIATGGRATMQKNRGRLKLRSLQIGQTGLDVNSYFQATGKTYVYLKTKKAVFTDNTYKKSKKIKIDSGIEVRISTTQNYENGIIVRFDSLLKNKFY